MRKRIRDQVDIEKIKYAAAVRIVLGSLLDDPENLSVYNADELSFTLIETAMKIRDLKKQWYRGAFANPDEFAPEVIRGLRAKNTKRHPK
jgi:hypothetical protein